MESSERPAYETDPTPSRTLVEEYRRVFRNEDHDASLMAIRYRATRTEFDLGVEYCNSDDPDDRAVGADVLSRLAPGNPKFLEESLDILIRLLGDEHPRVLFSAAYAVGQWRDPRAIPFTIPLATHPDSSVRYGAVHALTGIHEEDPDAISALVGLCSDDDLEVRNWALFGIGSQMDVDTPAIRNALFAGLSEADMEARGEALVGLARRGDKRVIEALFREWAGTPISILSIEAAEEMADPILLTFLEEFESTRDFSDNTHFYDRLKDAILACRTGVRGATDY